MSNLLLFYGNCAMGMNEFLQGRSRPPWSSCTTISIRAFDCTLTRSFSFLFCRKSTRTERSSAARSLKLPHQIWSTWESPSLATLWKTFVTTWLVYSFFLLSTCNFDTFESSFLCKERKRTVVTRTNPVLNKSTVRWTVYVIGEKCRRNDLHLGFVSKMVFT